jgi:hypothetical protein
MAKFSTGSVIPHKIPPPLLFGGLLISMLLGRILGLSAPLPKSTRPGRHTPLNDGTMVG